MTRSQDMARTANIIAAAALALGACSQSAAPTANTQVATPGDTQNRLTAMPEAERDGVFIRAIRDANQDCQHVDSSEASGSHQGFPVWTAHCSGGGTYTIVITNDGGATVINAAEARLADNSQAPANGAQPANTAQAPANTQ
jgi:hypothetical protein